MTYEYMGTGSESLPVLPNLKKAVAQSVSYDSQYSNFTFTAGAVEITASFLSAVIPKDLCRTSIPLSYLTTYVRSNDNATHSVQFYSHVNAAWAAFESNATISWDFSAASVDTWYEGLSRYIWAYLNQAGSSAYKTSTSLLKKVTFLCGETSRIPQRRAPRLSSPIRVALLETCVSPIR